MSCPQMWLDKHRAPAWYNAPGIIMAFQPVRAPDPLQAMYNMCGGQYRNVSTSLTVGVAPNWSPATGWTFTGSQYLWIWSTGMGSLFQQAQYTMIVRFSVTNAANRQFIIGDADAAASTYATGIEVNGYACDAEHIVSVQNNWTGAGSYTDSLTHAVANTLVTAAFTWTPGFKRSYIDGIYTNVNTASQTNTLAAGTHACFGRCGNYNGYYLTGRITAAAFYRRWMDDYEIRWICRQMAYCDVNPDWNVWAPQRRWFLPARTVVPRQFITTLGVSRTVIE